MPEDKAVQPGASGKLLNKRLALALLFVLAAAVAVPMWCVHYPPLLDFPTHVASTFVLAQLHNPHYDFARYYGADWAATPYITTDVLMVAFSRVMPALIAGKLMFSLGMIGLPLAAWFFLRQINPGDDAVAFWFLLISHNVFFRYGFIGFYCGLAFMFFALGLWLRFLNHPSTARWITACAALAATYFTHLLAFIFMGLIVGIYSLTRPRMKEWLTSAGLFVPWLACYFIFSRVVERQSSGAVFGTWDDKVDSLWHILSGNSDLLNHLAIAGVLALFVFGWIGNSQFQWQWRWVVVSFGLLITFFALPVGYGQGYDLDIRALPILFVTIFAMARFGRRAWKFAPLALLLFVVRTYDLTKQFRAAQPELEGLAGSFMLTPANAMVLPIVAGPDIDPSFEYYAHFSDYGTVDRGWISPYLLEDPGLLPLQIKMDAYYTPDGFWDMNYLEKIDWARVQDDYDYVYAYNVPQFEAGLRGIGDVIYISGKLELVRIHKKTPNAPAAPAAK
jgi:hypothetical protein